MNYKELIIELINSVELSEEVLKMIYRFIVKLI